MILINLTTDGKKIKAQEGSSTLEAAKNVGIEIPALCTDPNLEVVASCRLCMVEIEGVPKPDTTCTVEVKEGMIVETETPRLAKMRKQLLQLLLDSHPNNCLTCDKAGRCLFRKYTYEYNAVFRGHKGKKREYEKDTTSPYILKDDQKYILCSKCVRTCNQIEGRQVLTMPNRDYQTGVAMDWGKHFGESTCVSCNHCVSVCPVGALIDRRSMKKGRYWDTERKAIKREVCGYGREFDVISKNGKNIVVEANKSDNGRLLCLKGRMTAKLMYLGHPGTLYKKEKDGFVETTWGQITGLDRAVEKPERLNKE